MDEHSHDSNRRSSATGYTVSGMLRDAEVKLTMRLRPSIERSPMQLLSEAAAAGFVLGVLVPLRLQLVAMAGLVRFAVGRLASKKSGAGERAAPSPSNQQGE